MMRAAVIVPLAVAIAGGVLYHGAAKMIPRDLPPSLVLVGAYAVALLASLGTHTLLPGTATPAALARFAHPAVLALGLGAFLIETGYVAAYRTGLPVSLTSVLVNGVTAALLIPVGLVLFGERLSPTRGLGLLLCLAGVWLLRK